MKIPSLLNYQKYGPVGVAVLGLLALPVISRADDDKDKDRKKHDEHAEKHVEHTEHAEKKIDHAVEHTDKKKADHVVEHVEKKPDHVVEHLDKRPDRVVHEDRVVHKDEVRRADPRDHREPTIAVEKHRDPNVVIVHRAHPDHVVHDPRIVEVRHRHPNWVLREGNGWRGHGFYWGPPGVTFFAEAPGVSYYASADEVPVEYDSEVTTTETPAINSDTEIGAAVQKALLNQGYYKGAVDGQIGPMSQRAIKRYQSDHGMDPTGLITDSLLKSLGVD